MGRVRELIAPLALAAATLGCAERAPAPGADVLLLTVDTLRADALGCYGGPAGDTPSIDALASRGLLFEQARAAIPITTPSLGTILTGRLPRNHGALGNAFDLGVTDSTLVERLSGAGYRTAAFLPSFLADKEGFKPGFDVYRFPTLGRGILTADEVIAQAQAWLERAADVEEPWFVWVHVIEPHSPYDPPPELERWALGEAGLGDFRVPMALRDPSPSPRSPLTDRERAALEALYRAEVVETDRALAPLLELGAARGPDDRPLLTVFAADHGEMLGERNAYVGHTAWLYDEMLHVPLIVALDGGGASFGHAGTRSSTPASLHDLATTICAAVGVPWTARDQACDLVRAAAQPPRRMQVFETFGPEGHFDQQAVLIDGFKLHRAVGDAPGWPLAGRPDHPRLYAVAVEGEVRDLAPAESERIASMERMFATWERGQSDPASWARPEVGERERQALEALGYLQESPSANAPEPEPDDRP
jgi:arylsulfatase A-like enzyme